MHSDAHNHVTGNAVHLRDGKIDLGGGITLDPALTEETLLSEARNRAEPFIHNGPHKSYRLPAVELNGRPFVPVVFFSNGALTMASLAWADPSRVIGDDPWKNWSEQRERARAADDAAWLAKVLTGIGTSSDTYTFGWGIVSSGFSPQSGGASITLRYTGSSGI